MKRAPVAAVDCGTNSTRLLIADHHGETMERCVRITRLGQGVDSTRLLAAEAVDRTLTALAEYRGLMDRNGVSRIRMVATSAVRDARNGADFLEAAAKTVSAPAEVLSGEEEGRLSYAGAVMGLPASDGERVVVDIGGGSTEIIAGRGADVRTVSLDIGCVRVTERFFRHDPPLPEELKQASGFVRSEIQQAMTVLWPAGRHPESHDLRLVGLAGTVSTLSMLAQGLERYDRGRIHQSVLSRDVVESWRDRLAAESAPERLRRPAIAHGREDVIVAGALILAEAMQALRTDQCIVSESDILDGIIDSILTAVEPQHRMPSNSRSHAEDRGLALTGSP